MPYSTNFLDHRFAPTTKYSMYAGVVMIFMKVYVAVAMIYSMLHGIQGGGRGVVCELHRPSTDSLSLHSTVPFTTIRIPNVLRYVLARCYSTILSVDRKIFSLSFSHAPLSVPNETSNDKN